MAYASRLGRARISATSPEAAGQCDRCGFVYSLNDLRWQTQWQGTTLNNIWLRVCQECLDIPNEQLRAITLPADPLPVWQPRTVDWTVAETDYQTISGGTTIDPQTGIPVPGDTTLVTQDGNPLVTQQSGVPDGLDPNAVMPLMGTMHYGVRLFPLSIMSNSSDTIQVTFSTAHGLSTNDQIVVEGLNDPNACGMFSVTVISPMVFTYQVYGVIETNSLLLDQTLMRTVIVGIPRGFDQIPQVGNGTGMVEPLLLLLQEDGFAILTENGSYLLQD